VPSRCSGRLSRFSPAASDSRCELSKPTSGPSSRASPGPSVPGARLMRRVAVGCGPRNNEDARTALVRTPSGGRGASRHRPGVASGPRERSPGAGPGSSSPLWAAQAATTATRFVRRDIVPSPGSRAEALASGSRPTARQHEAPVLRRKYWSERWGASFQISPTTFFAPQGTVDGALSQRSTTPR